VVAINYRHQIVFIKWLGTHAESIRRIIQLGNLTLEIQPRYEICAGPRRHTLGNPHSAGPPLEQTLLRKSYFDAGGSRADLA